MRARSAAAAVRSGSICRREFSPHGASGRALIDFGDRDFCHLAERSVGRSVLNVAPSEDRAQDRITADIAEAARAQGSIYVVDDSVKISIVARFTKPAHSSDREKGSLKFVLVVSLVFETRCLALEIKAGVSGDDDLV